MGETNKGNIFVDEGCSSWFIKEAECIDSLDTIEDLFEHSTDGSDVSNLIDDVDNCLQGNSLALFNKQLTEECDADIQALKRKFTTSPEQSVNELSPRLAAVQISPQRSIKRRLFGDSGIEEDEAENSYAEVSEIVNCDNAENLNLLNNENYKGILLNKCKEKFGVPYTELTRNFKSDKTCSPQWIIFVHSIQSELLEASKIQLQGYCEFLQLLCVDFSGVYFVLFKAPKNRETVQKLFCQILNCKEIQMLTDPPRTRSAAVALFFYQKSFGNASYKVGDFPEWVKKNTLINHQSAVAADSFDLSQMIQFAYDNNLTDESSIAYRYAQVAEEDTNAAAFLKSNNQARFVRDACTMVRHYKRQEMRDLTMSEWIWKCSDDCEGEGDWKTIALFFKYQHVNFVHFLTVFRNFLKSIPKQNCIVFYGPSDTGKSYFCHSLIRFMKGKVINFMNRASHFWLSPLVDCKMGLLDDCTFQCWQHLDVNMRGALDGNEVCIDSKHKNPTQITLPPMLITTNFDVEKEESLQFLKSRLQIFHFPNRLPTNDDGSLVYKINNDTWQCFFRKFATQIDLTPREDLQNESGRSDKTFRCTSGEINGTI
ncbi:E1 [Gammapapillomavirus sp.]|uniref:Replication protein E1 n=1 Tax=Human papillomavirus TaxID=10566 RepID=A0A385PKT4_9PAPI|nr:E1 [Gammapapillomavirus sp.]ATQ38170.1 E1 [Gammapapillomavirus sp.]AYA93616.2 MAG: E1 protein [Human papillomavirus]